MSTTGMVGMVACILVGFVCMVAAAGGYRRGWRPVAWGAWVVAAFVFLTIVPLVLALTVGLEHG